MPALVVAHQALQLEARREQGLARHALLSWMVNEEKSSYHMSALMQDKVGGKPERRLSGNPLKSTIQVMLASMEKLASKVMPVARIRLTH